MENNELCLKMPFIATFNKTFNLNGVNSLLLDNIEIYIFNKNSIGKKVAFDIVVKQDEKYIIPRCDFKKHCSFLLKGYKVVGVEHRLKI